jgi:hypothetical protein
LKYDFYRLLVVQLSAPIARVAFAFLIVPIHPRGVDIITILAISEMCSTFLVFGRNYLIQSGYDHKIVGKIVDKLILPIVAGGVFVALSNVEQKSMINSVIVVTLAITCMSMLNAVFLANRKLNYILPLNIGVYAVITFADLYGPVIATLAVVIWVLVEISIPSIPQRAEKSHLPVISVVLAFVSQRIDVQISALYSNPTFISEVFMLNTLIIPLAVFVRVFGNTALLRGEGVFLNKIYSTILLTSLSIFYCLILYLYGDIYGNLVIIENIYIILCSVFISFALVPYREKISIDSSNGNFLPLFIFSVLGVLPSLIVFLYILFFGVVSVGIFITALYLLPRLLMMLYAMKKYGV